MQRHLTTGPDMIAALMEADRTRRHATRSGTTPRRRQDDEQVPTPGDDAVAELVARLWPGGAPDPARRRPRWVG